MHVFFSIKVLVIGSMLIYVDIRFLQSNVWCVKDIFDYWREEIRQTLQQKSILFKSPCIPLSFDGQRRKSSQFLYCSTQKVAGYYVIPSENSEILSVRPSVSASFPDSNLSSFWSIFFNFVLTLISGRNCLGLQMINNRVIYGPWLM